MRRVLLLAAALTMAVSAVSVVALNGVAGAKTVKITCKSVSGSAVSGFITLGTCTGGDTGGSSKPLSISVLANGGPVPWVTTPNVTTFGAPSETQPSAKKCPGYIKPTKTNPTPNEPSAVGFSGNTTADSGDGLVPGPYSGEVCIGDDMDATFTILKKIVIT